MYAWRLRNHHERMIHPLGTISSISWKFTSVFIRTCTERYATSWKVPYPYFSLIYTFFLLQASLASTFTSRHHSNLAKSSNAPRQCIDLREPILVSGASTASSLAVSAAHWESGPMISRIQASLSSTPSRRSSGYTSYCDFSESPYGIYHFFPPFPGSVDTES